MANRIDVLGSVGVGDGGTTIEVRGRLKRRLLARLALHPDELVTADALCEAMWGSDQPATARQSLHVHINHLRRALDEAGMDDPIATVEGGYRIADGFDVDARQFERLATAGFAAADRGDRREAAALLGDALALWGEPFADLADDLSVVTEQIRLVTLADDVLDRHHELRVELDDPDVVRSLQSIVASQPLRDAPYAQLMQALAQQGDHAQALRVYDDAVRLFAGELGISPSSLLSEMAEAMRQQRAPIADVPPAVGRVRELLDGTDRVIFVDGAQLGDAASIIDRLAQDLRAEGIRVVRRVVPPAAFDPMEPLLGSASIPMTTSTAYRTEMLAAAAAHLDDACGRNGILVIEGFDRASTPVIDAITHIVERERGDHRILAVLDGPLSGRFDHLAQLAGDIRSVDDEVEARDAPHLGTEDLRLLGAIEASILPVPGDAVLRSLGLDGATASDSLARLVALGLVHQEVGGRLGLRRRVPDAVEPDAGYHRSMVAIIDEWPTTAPGRSSAEIHHRLAAGDRLGDDATADAARRAVDRLEALGAHREIVELLADVTRAGDEAPLDLVVRVGRSQIRAGDVEDGRSSLARAIEQAAADEQPDQHALAVRALGEARSPQMTDDQHRALLTASIDGLAGYPSADELVETHVQLLTDLAGSWFLSEPEISLERSLHALEFARSSGDDRSVARALTGLIQAEMRPAHAQRRLELALEAQELARRADLTETLVLALTYEAQALIELGQLRRADPPLHYAAALATDVQVPRFKWWAASWSALLTLATEGPDVAEDRFREAYELWPSVERPDALDCYMTQLANLHLLRGTGGQLADALLDIAIRSGSGKGAAALAFAQDGEIDRARTLLAEIFEPGVLAGVHTIARAPLISAAAEAALLCEVSDGAHVLREQAEPLADTHIVLNTWGGGGYYWGSMRHTLAVIDELAGDTAAALDGYRRAAREQAEAGGLTFAARSEAAADRLV